MKRMIAISKLLSRTPMGRMFVVAVSAVILFLVLGGCREKEAHAPQAITRPVKVATVGDTMVAGPISLPGITRASRRVELSFKVPGPLVELPVDEGQEVKQGQIIACILPRDFKIRVDQAKARALEAERQYDRYKALYERRQVARAEFDHYKAARDISRAQMEDSQNALNDTYLKAPFSGVVAKRYVENHQEVQAKQPIVYLQDISRIEVLVDIPEILMSQFLEKDPIHAAATFAAAPGRIFSLKFKEFSTDADPRTRTYQMVLEMLKPEDINILPGMTATVTISFEHPVSASDRIVIPAIAVTHDSEKKPFVWVLDETDMTVKKNMVQVGELTDSNGIVIRDGLHGGEKIVTAGVTKLRPGMQVSVWDASN